MLEALNRMIPQLSRSAAQMGMADLEKLLESESVNFFAAIDTEIGKIVGVLTLLVFPIPTGIRAWIEDVVVDAAYRGRGVGKALVAAAITRGSSLGAKTIDLTSRPSRVEANSLYLRMGFLQRETNVYRFTVS